MLSLMLILLRENEPARQSCKTSRAHAPRFESLGYQQKQRGVGYGLKQL